MCGEPKLSPPQNRPNTAIKLTRPQFLHEAEPTYMSASEVLIEPVGALPMQVALGWVGLGWVAFANRANRGHWNGGSDTP